MQRATRAISSYDGSLPLAGYLKRFFRQHPEMGSRDRRFVQQLAYHYFRLNRALRQYDTETAIVLAHLLCSAEPDDFILHWIKEKKIELHITPHDALANLNEVNNKGYECRLQNQFPALHHISKKINEENFLLSHLLQPYTWVRSKRDKTETVKKELREQNIDFELTALSPNAIGFKRHFDFNKLQSFQNGWFEVQDLSSQLTGNLFEPKPGEKWWDCCAASGGKSLLLYDLQPDITITVSDSRETILNNLKKRFAKAGVKNYQSILIDLEHEQPTFSNSFDGIIVDAPCTGSGTWARNPERMTFFDEKEIEHYAQKQRSILTSVIRHLKPGGKLIYITCSVYAEENENILEFLTQNFSLKTEAMQYFKGYEYHADTMFAARLALE